MASAVCVTPIADSPLQLYWNAQTCDPYCKCTSSAPRPPVLTLMHQHDGNPSEVPKVAPLPQIRPPYGGRS